jgi:hypothetical protein
MYIRVNNILYSPETIDKIDCNHIENLIVRVHTISGEIIKVEGLEAIEVAMQANPSVVEGKRMKFKKHMWMTHNLIGHPFMQLFAFLRLYKLAMWIHDVTVPKPIGKKYE